MTLHLKSKTELSAAVAEHVLGRQIDRDDPACLFMRMPDENAAGCVFESWQSIPDFATSADAVLPIARTFLMSAIFSQRKAFWNAFACLAVTGRTDWVAAFPDCIGLAIMHEQFARNLCLALLRAKGHEVVYEEGA